MKLGILVKNDRHLQHVAGMALAATKKKHDVIILLTGEGTRLLGSNQFLQLAKSDRISVRFCRHSAAELGVDTKQLPQHLQPDSQLNNTKMMYEADKVVAL